MLFQTSLDVRNYDLDARHRVSPGAVARYFEHARWQAIQTPETGLAALFSEGRKIVVRAQALHFHQALSRGEELVLELEIAQVGRTSFKFWQSARRRADGALAAEALVTGVVLDAGGRPTAVPASVRVTTGSSPSWASPPLGPRPASCLALPVAVRPSDLDTLQHVNHSRYVDYADDVRELAGRAGAYGSAPVAGSYPRALHVSYEHETKLGDELIAYTWADELGQLSVELVNAGTARVVAGAVIELA